MRTVLICISGALVIGLYGSAEGTVRRVPSQYSTIQAGINAAVDGDTVLVADGTYTGTGNRDIRFWGKKILVTTENGPEATTIDCQGSAAQHHRGFLFDGGEDSTSVLQGFTIKNGYIDDPGFYGGAIFCVATSPTIRGNRLTGNFANQGGAICCAECEWATIEGNTITGNTAWIGGGIACIDGSDMTIRGNTITENEAYSDLGQGGGIYCEWSASVIEGNLIMSNWCNGEGGGIYCNYDAPTIVGNTITENSADWYGGGIVGYNSWGTVKNCILWDNSAATGPEIFIGGSDSLTVTYCDVEGGWAGTGNINQNPLFVGGPLGDHYLEQTTTLLQQSPCVDAGDPGSPVPEATTRIDGHPDEWPVDMGYHYPWDRPPDLVDQPDTTITETHYLTFTLVATDPDTDLVTFSSPNLPAGATLNANSGVFQWTPTYGQAGVYPTTFIATDNSPYAQADTEQTVITVVDLNRPPNLIDQPDTTVLENQYLTFTLVATDPDTDLVTFSSPNLPVGATLNSNSGVFQWTPSYAQAGLHTVTFIATDNGSPALADTEQTNIAVTDVNRPPNLIDQPDTTVSETQYLTFTLVATDPDTDLVTFSSPNLPPGATLNSVTGVFQWTAGYAQSGVHPVGFIATDNGSPALADTEVTFITVLDVNRPPDLFDQPDTVVAENQYLTFTLVATDPDTDDVLFSSPNLPPGATLNANSGVFEWTPEYGQAGNYLTMFIATDNGSPALADTEQTLITVGDVNRPPNLTDQPDTTIAENQYLTFTLEAEDPDGDSIVFSSPHLPEGATLDEVTGVFEWTPDYGQSGNNLAVFIATDNGSPALADTEWTRIIVGDVNRPPDLTDQPDTTVAENECLAFTLVAEDPDEDSMSFFSPDLPEGAVLDAQSGLFEWTPTYAQAGLYTVTFIATDNGSPALADTEQTEITVTDVVGVSGGEEEPVIPLSRYLGQNCPNPFGSATTIRYGLVTPAHVRVDIYDIRGAFVRMLVDERLPAGHHRAAWDGRDDRGHRVASGVYFCRLETGDFRETRRMILLR